MQIFAMKTGFCTIITSDFLPFAEILFYNLRKYDPSISFSVLIVDDFSNSENFEFSIITIKQLRNKSIEEVKQVSKYSDDKGSCFRWALKPVFLKFLLEKGLDKVIYIDPDIYFYNNPDFLFELLDEYKVILTPHWRSKNPLSDSINFDLLFKGGIYNAGFFGCNKDSIQILDWWLEMCSYKMNKQEGFYVDQAYLNLMPVYYPSQVKVIDHKGCNVAGWNLVECPRTLIDGEVMINGKFPIIFVHFTPGTVNAICSGQDPLLLSYLRKYESKIKEFEPTFTFSAALPKKSKRKSFLKYLRKK